MTIIILKSNWENSKAARKKRIRKKVKLIKSLWLRLRRCLISKNHRRSFASAIISPECRAANYGTDKLFATAEFLLIKNCQNLAGSSFYIFANFLFPARFARKMFRRFADSRQNQKSLPNRPSSRDRFCFRRKFLRPAAVLS